MSDFIELGNTGYVLMDDGSFYNRITGERLYPGTTKGSDDEVLPEIDEEYPYE